VRIHLWIPLENMGKRHYKDAIAEIYGDEFLDVFGTIEE
jgi:hypothetical protein